MPTTTKRKLLPLQTMMLLPPHPSSTSSSSSSKRTADRVRRSSSRSKPSASDCYSLMFLDKNPSTGRKIKPHGRVSHNLVKECLEHAYPVLKEIKRRSKSSSPPKQWHAAVGIDMYDVCRQFESSGKSVNPISGRRFRQGKRGRSPLRDKLSRECIELALPVHAAIYRSVL